MIVGIGPIVASVSGGKDSAALSLWLTEQGLAHTRVFADTGWEHEATYEYLRGPLTKAIGPITEVAGDLQMAALIRKKGMFPSRLRRFCTQDLKVRPLITHMVSVGAAINAVGIRAEESAARSKQPEWEWWEPIAGFIWRPLINWTLQDVIDIHRRHGLRPNPLYMLGATRVGCWPCIFARKAEIKLVADLTPGRIDEIRALEAEVLAAAQARSSVAGTEQPEARAFFHASSSAQKVGLDSAHEWPPVPIDSMVEWSRTGKGGRQFDLIQPEQDGGCVRWGLCEPAVDK